MKNTYRQQFLKINILNILIIKYSPQNCNEVFFQTYYLTIVNNFNPIGTLCTLFQCRCQITINLTVIKVL